MDILIISYTLLAILSSIYLYIKWIGGYWKRKGYPYVNLTFFKDPSENITESYNKLKRMGAKFGGIHLFHYPILMAIDMEVLKNIMQKDFDHFVNRDVYCNEKAEPLGANLFSLKDDAWKNVRSQLTPVFSSAKMKGMFQTFVHITGHLVNNLAENSTLNKPVDVKDILERYTTDTIGSCCFGIECNSIKHPNSKFLKVGRDMIKSMNFRVAVMFLIPERILHFFNVRLMSKFIEDHFRNTVRETVDYREKNQISRKDIMQSLIDLKNGKDVKSDNKPGRTSPIPRLTLNQVAAQCFVFFIGGFDTSSSTMSMALLELALNQTIQDKLRAEIIASIEETDGNITYDALMKMEYLDQVINETLRKQTPVRFMFRVCNKDYKIPNSHLTINKGTRVILPYEAVHHDPEYFPDPDKFDPERFSNENRNKIPNLAFLPFGEGPRMCIGYRFGMLLTKVGIAAIVKDFKITLSEKTQQPIEFEHGLLPTVKGGLWLNCNKID